MKNIKRLLAAFLVLVVVFSFAGCHKKDEIAVTIGDIEFTSAYYMCALINADSEAKTKVSENLSDEESTEEIDYYSQKIDGKGFVTWVEDAAIDYLKKIAAYKTLCKDNELEIDKEELANIESYASYYWSSYGYSAYFEPNGVGFATYTQYMKDSYYSELYFEHLYGAEGEKAIAADEVSKKLYDNFLIANVLEASIDSEMTDTEKTELKDKMNTYVTELKDGKKTFEQVYNDYNEVEEETETEETTDSTDEETAEEEVSEPLDKYASILGAEDTGYDSDHYETAKAMATGEIKLVELEDEAGYVIIVKQDIKADPYYLENLDMTIRHLIADEDYEKIIDDFAGKLEVDINDYAVKQFKVKKIKEPEYSY
ncbi:MAG: hypothetical protein IKD04_04305 [Clostridia bacterium]|nr:hypothetical protein [Clostridia bacterium]